MELGVLSHIIEDAPAAFPLLLAVGRKLELMSTVNLGELQERVANVVEAKIDSRLCTQYCITLFCAEEVRVLQTLCLQYLKQCLLPFAADPGILCATYVD